MKTTTQPRKRGPYKRSKPPTVPLCIRAPEDAIRAFESRREALGLTGGQMLAKLLDSQAFMQLSAVETADLFLALKLDDMKTNPSLAARLEPELFGFGGLGVLAVVYPYGKP